MDEKTAETNVEEFDEFKGDADLEQGAEAQVMDSDEASAKEPKEETGGTIESDDGETGEKDAEVAKPQKKPWKTEENARAAQLRRERERKEIEERAYQKGIVDSVGGVNPYNNQKIEDEADIQEFLVMREIEKSGGDPISDYPSYMKKKAREQAQKAAEEAKAQEQKGWFQKDFKEFLETHPDLDFESLQKDEAFQLFAEGKIGNQSLTKIYDDFIKVAGKYEAKAEKTAQKLFAKAKASPGSLAGGEPQAVSYATMSDADFEKKLNAVLTGREKI